MGFIELEIKFLIKAINPGFVDFAVQTKFCCFNITLIPSIDTPCSYPSFQSSPLFLDKKKPCYPYNSVASISCVRDDRCTILEYISLSLSCVPGRGPAPAPKLRESLTPCRTLRSMVWTKVRTKGVPRSSQKSLLEWSSQTLLNREGEVLNPEVRCQSTNMRTHMNNFWPMAASPWPKVGWYFFLLLNWLIITYTWYNMVVRF